MGGANQPDGLCQPCKRKRAKRSTERTRAHSHTANLLCPCFACLQVWVPTQFHSDIFARGGVDPGKIVVIPEPVDTEFFSPEHAAKLDAAAAAAVASSSATDAAPSTLFVYPHEPLIRNGGVRPYRFLSIFKWEERKGWQVLLEAFLREFATYPSAEITDAATADESHTTPQPVVLYILTSAYHSDADFQKRIDSFVATLTWTNLPAGVSRPTLPAIRLLPSGLSSTALVSLYGGADCFVLSSRGEGWGRPHVEAMSMSLPLIATHWSGPSEFMTDHNSYPLSHLDQLVEIAEGPFKGHRWAQPSVSHLRELMRRVVTNPEEARSKGLQARRDMQAKYCPACVANIVVKELARIQHIRTRAEEAAAAAMEDTVSSIVAETDALAGSDAEQQVESPADERDL